MHDEGCAFHQMSLPAAVKQRDTAMQKYSRVCQGPLTSLIHSHGAFWRIVNIHDDADLLGCHRSENCK